MGSRNICFRVFTKSNNIPFFIISTRFYNHNASNANTRFHRTGLYDFYLIVAFNRKKSKKQKRYYQKDNGIKNFRYYFEYFSHFKRLKALIPPAIFDKFDKVQPCEVVGGQKLQRVVESF